MERPDLDKLTEGDTLIVSKLDRIARIMTQGSELVTALIRRGLCVHILNVGVMDNTLGSKLIRIILFAFAEFERDMIVERTQEGKAIARTKDGFKEGRLKRYTDIPINIALGLLQNHSYAEVERMTKISKSTLIRAMRELRIKEKINA